MESAAVSGINPSGSSAVENAPSPILKPIGLGILLFAFMLFRVCQGSPLHFGLKPVSYYPFCTKLSHAIQLNADHPGDARQGHDAGRSHEQVADHGPAARRVSELRYSGAEGNRVYLQIVQMYLKEKPFLFGTIRVQSGRTTHKQAGTSSQRPAPCRQNE